MLSSRLLRPLLNETRESLRQWALAHQLSWIEDESNQDDTYDRNFLRLRVIPVLRERWPHFSEAVARSASLCAEQEQLLDEMLAAELASLVAEDGSLAIAPLATMSPPRRAALLRRWLAGQQAPMPAREVPERLWHEVALAREDASPCLRLGEFTVRRFQQRLYWVKYLPGQTDSVQRWPDWRQPLRLADGLGELTLRPGGRLRPPSADELGHRPLSRQRPPAYCRAPWRTQAQEALAGAGRCSVATRHHAAAVLRRNADCRSGRSVCDHRR